MNKVLQLFRVIGILMMASPLFFLPPKTVGATSGMYLPLVYKSWAGVPSLTVKNSCSFAIWVQQSKEHQLTDTPLIQKIEAGQSFDYAVDPKGIISTRFWPKWGCDAQGENCAWGQSVGGAGGPDDYSPCPAGGCHAPADSKLEVTWGCAYPDPANNPQCEHKKAQTFYNGSIVDGYSLPFRITRSGDLAGSCQDIDCSGLTMAACPKEDNLRQGKTADHPEYRSVDLHIILGGQETACFSPCKKLNYPTFGGLNLDEQTDAAIMYCCPTPPISSPECQAGSVPQTQYVTTVHQMCPNTYGYAYDELLGNFNCHYSTKFTATFCP
jgi:Thaumatin family